MALTNQHLAKLLRVAYNQRERQAKKMEADYGSESAAVKEANAELAEINRFITDLMANPTAKTK